MRRIRIATAVPALLVLAAFAPARAGPPPACPAAIVPGYPAPGAPPNIRTWAKDAVPQDALAGCAGWRGWQPNLVVALTGAFRLEGGAQALLGRLGAISTLAGVRYWSVNDGRWNRLITEASALAGNDGWTRRGDFTAPELASGAARHFIQFDNRSTGGTIFRMRATGVADDALRVTVENTTAVSFMFVTAYEPGDVRSVHAFTRAGPGLWRYFGLAGLRGGALTGIGRSSAINRAVAMYRHLAGIPTDREPPAARE